MVYAVWYNKNMFAEHGWEPARTWDEFFALCEQIKAAGIPPLAFQGRYPAMPEPSSTIPTTTWPAGSATTSKRT